MGNAESEKYRLGIGQIVSIHCLPGHRFPDGNIKKNIVCEEGQYWSDIESCEGQTISISVILLLCALVEAPFINP